MKFSEFKGNIINIYGECFAHSTCIVNLYRLYGDCYIDINCKLAENSYEWRNGFSENDMFKISFWIDLPREFDPERDELPENLTMQARAHSYIIKPDDEFFYCDYRKTPYRKSSGTAEKIISVFGKFIDKLYFLLMEDLNSGNIHHDFKELVERKI